MKVVEYLLDLSVSEALAVKLPKCSGRESRIALVSRKFDQHLDKFFPLRREPHHEIRYAISCIGPYEPFFLAQLAKHPLKRCPIKDRVQQKPDFLAARCQLEGVLRKDLSGNVH